VRMVEWTVKRLKALSFSTEVRDVGMQTMEDGSKIKLPPVIFATLGNDPNKLNLLIYGHLDVQPAKMSDGWNPKYEPFTLTEDGLNLYGRGSTDDKGPVLGWLHCIEAYQKSGVALPVNIKMVLESMEECGSEGLEELLEKEKSKFLKGVDLVTISDNYWLGTEKPCLTYGLRGLCYIHVEIECGTKDLHSGVFGGAVQEALPDLIWLLDQLLDSKGQILIPGILDSVAPLDEEEKKLYKEVDFCTKAFQSDAGVRSLRCPDDKEATLMNRWRYPALSIHGIEGAFADPGSKTVIPRKVTGKFSIRLVPNQDPVVIEKLVNNYLNKKWAERKSGNKMTILPGHSGKPWMAKYNHPNYQAAAKAIELVYKEKPQYTREGGSIPITLTFQELTGRNVLLLPMGQSDDGAHSQNEKISKRNYLCGTKVFAAYMQEVSKLNKKDL